MRLWCVGLWSSCGGLLMNCSWSVLYLCLVRAVDCGLIRMGMWCVVGVLLKCV